MVEECTHRVRGRIQGAGGSAASPLNVWVQRLEVARGRLYAPRRGVPGSRARIVVPVRGGKSSASQGMRYRVTGHTQGETRRLVSRRGRVVHVHSAGCFMHAIDCLRACQHRCRERIKGVYIPGKSVGGSTSWVGGHLAPEMDRRKGRKR